MMENKVLEDQLVATTALMLDKYYSNNELSALFNTVLQLKTGRIHKQNKKMISEYYNAEYKIIEVLRGDKI